MVGIKRGPHARTHIHTRKSTCVCMDYLPMEVGGCVILVRQSDIIQRRPVRDATGGSSGAIIQNRSSSPPHHAEALPHTCLYPCPTRKRAASLTPLKASAPSSHLPARHVTGMPSSPAGAPQVEARRTTVAKKHHLQNHHFFCHRRTPLHSDAYIRILVDVPRRRFCLEMYTIALLCRFNRVVLHKLRHSWWESLGQVLRKDKKKCIR